MLTGMFTPSRRTGMRWVLSLSPSLYLIYMHAALVPAIGQ